MRSYLLAGVVLLVSQGLLLAQPNAPVPEQTPPAALSNEQLVQLLIERGQHTAKTFLAGELNIAWSTRINANGVQLDVHRFHQRQMLRCMLEVTPPGGKPVRVVDYVERDGVWYASDEARRLGKYRPYEVPWNFPNTYHLLLMTNLQTVSAIPGMKIKAVDGNVVTVQAPLPLSSKQQISATVTQMTEGWQRFSPGPRKDQLRVQIDKLQKLVDEGQVRRVQLQTGIYLDSGSPELPFEVIELQVGQPLPDKVFAIAQQDWVDHTSDPTQGVEVSDLVLMSNAPAVTVATADKAGDILDVMLVNLATRQFRRLANPMGSTFCASFSPERTTVYYCGMSPHEGRMGLFGCDLTTGQAFTLGAGRFPPGILLDPVASPDGKWVAVVAVRPNLLHPICLVDTATEEVIVLGAPLDTAFLSWLDDSSGLVLVAREYPDLQKPAVEWVARLDMQGQLRKLVLGTHPQVLPHRGRILFRTPDQRWHTCDLDGQDVQLYHEGMPKHGSPAPSPDGKRVMWMRYAEGQLLQPVVQDVEQGTIQELHPGPGFWAKPAWR